MTSALTKVTPDEIARYREELAFYPEALDALTLIEENEGNLEQAASLLAMEHGLIITKKKPSSLESLLCMYKDIICDDSFIDDLMTGLLTAGVTSLTASGQIPTALATPLVIYLVKVGVKNWCKTHQ